MARKSKFVNIPKEILEKTAEDISSGNLTYKKALEDYKKEYPKLKLKKARPSSLSAFLKKNGYIKVAVADEFIAYVINKIFEKEVENMGEEFTEISSGTQSMGDSGLDSYGYIGAYLAVGELFYIDQYLFDEELGKDDPTMNELIAFIKRNRQNLTLTEKDVQDYAEDKFIAGASEQEQQMAAGSGMSMESFMGEGGALGGENSSEVMTQMRNQMMGGMGTMDMGEVDIELEMSSFGDIEEEFSSFNQDTFEEFSGDLAAFDDLIEVDSGMSEEEMMKQLEDYKKKTEKMKDISDADLIESNYIPINKQKEEEEEKSRYQMDITGLKDNK